MKNMRKFVLDLEEDYKENKFLYAVMWNKAKPKPKLCSVLDKSVNLVWRKYAYLKTWVERFTELLNRLTDSEDITEDTR
jgi:hypothetical protein